jgi:hypothetical protein
MVALHACATRKDALMLKLVVTSLAATTVTVAAAQHHAPQLNEIRLDSLEPNQDVEYAEIMGVPGTPLDGYALVVLGDSGEDIGPLATDSGFVEAVVRLDGYTIPADRCLLVHSAALLWNTPDVVADLHLEDVDNITVLLVEGAKCWEGEDLDWNDDGVLDFTPWSAIVDSVAIACGTPGTVSEWTYAPTFGPSDGFPVFQVARCADTNEWRAGGVYYTPGSVDTAGTMNAPCNGSLCVADFNADGRVDAQDLASLLADWDRLGTAADLNADGFVGSADIAILLANWGECPL